MGERVLPPQTPTQRLGVGKVSVSLRILEGRAVTHTCTLPAHTLPSPAAAAPPRCSLPQPARPQGPPPPGAGSSPGAGELLPSSAAAARGWTRSHGRGASSLEGLRRVWVSCDCGLAAPCGLRPTPPLAAAAARVGMEAPGYRRRQLPVLLLCGKCGGAGRAAFGGARRYRPRTPAADGLEAAGTGRTSSGHVRGPPRQRFLRGHGSEVQETCELPPIPLQEHPLGRGVFSAGQGWGAGRQGLAGAFSRAEGAARSAGLWVPCRAGPLRHRGPGGGAERSICAAGPAELPSRRPSTTAGGEPRNTAQGAQPPHEQRFHRLPALVGHPGSQIRFWGGGFGCWGRFSAAGEELIEVRVVELQTSSYKSTDILQIFHFIEHCTARKTDFACQVACFRSL